MREPIPSAGTFARELAANFDRTFAQARPDPPVPPEGFLALRVGTDGYAIHVRQVAQVLQGRAITPLPTDIPGLLGLAGYRADMVPVYGLRSLLGHVEGPPPRWLMLVEKPAKVMLGFDEFEGYLQVCSQDISHVDAAGESRPHVQQVMRTPRGSRVIVSVPSLMEHIRACSTRGVS